METKVGATVLATDQGLGYLAKSFFDHKLIDKVYVKEHSSRPNHREWYSPESLVATPEDLLACDTLLFFEDPFDWKLIPKARETKTKTILMVMYECTRSPLPYFPDVVWSPSLLDQKYYPESLLIQVPVEVPWRLRSKAEVFVHNAGNGGLGGRNGTRELLEALQYVKSPIKLILRSQVPIDLPTDSRIDFRLGTFEDIWSEGDVFIFPEKFNGLSLPLQEAYASGMLVMCGDRFPMNTWLPREPLIPVESYRKDRIAVEFQSAQFSPTIIALKIDEWFNRDISKYSLSGKEWAERNSWENLYPLFSKILKGEKSNQ